MTITEVPRRAIPPDELTPILREHEEWLESAGRRGSRADLAGTDLTGADLRDRNLRFARLAEAKFTGSVLSGARLGRADLRRADLQGAIGLTGEQLAGADLSGAHLPGAVGHFERITQLREASRSTQTLVLTCVTACLYSALTIMTTRDSGLVTNSPTSSLPIIQAAVPIVMFFGAAPLLLLAAHAALLLALHRQWEIGLRLPARFPDTSSSDQRADVFPVQTMPFRRALPAPGRGPGEPRLRYVGPAVALWALVPVTLALFWARYLPRHDWPITVVHVLALALSLAMAALSAQQVWRSVARAATGQFDAALDQPVHRRLALRALGFPVVAFAGGLLVFAVLSEGAIEGTPYHVQLVSTPATPPAQDPGTATSVAATSDGATCGDLGSTNVFVIAGRWLRCPGLGVRLKAGWIGGDVSDGIALGRHKWIPLGLGMLGVTSYASLEDEEMSTRPTPWKFPGATDPSTRDALAIGEFGVLRAANLNGRDLRNANLRGAFLADARIRGANLSQASLVEAKLPGADLGSCRLERADLSRADLQNANLTRARLGEARLAAADLRRAKLADATASRARMNDAKLDGAELTGLRADRAILNSARLVGVSGQSAILRDADLSGALLVGAKLREAVMKKANLTEADLTCADLRKVTLEEATLDKTRFHLALIDETTTFSPAAAADPALATACRPETGRTGRPTACAAYLRETACSCLTAALLERAAPAREDIDEMLAECVRRARARPR